MKFQWTIGRKLAGLSLVALAFVAAVGATGYAATARLSATTEDLLRTQEALKLQMQADMAHDAVRSEVLVTLLAGQRSEREAAQAGHQALKAKATELAESLEALEKLQLDAAAREALAKVKPRMALYVKAATTLADHAFRDYADHGAQLEAFGAAFRALESEMQKLTALIEQRARSAQEESAEAATLARTAILVALALSAAVLLAISWRGTRSIVQPIREAVAVARTVATGDLSSHIVVRGSDETAQLLAALAQMNDSLVGLVGSVRQGSEHIASGTVQIANGNQDLSQRTEEQASNLQQTAASMEQISAAVHANAGITRQATEKAGSASESAAASGAAVKRLVATMAGISEASRRITEIISVIDGIAFQTNILALNAAVEAARAGDQGRGFAVVAAEVRTLAQRSASAAKEIKALIESSVAQVSAGASQATHAGDSMEAVVRQVAEVRSLLEEIHGATAEQTKGVAEISQAVTQIDRVTQSNASLVEEAAAAADSLNRQAQVLLEAVSRFRLGQQQLAGADADVELRALPA